MHITVCYELNFEAICSDFTGNYFDSLSQAIEFLQGLEVLISEGQLDSYINAHLEELSKCATHARAKRRFAETGTKIKHIGYENFDLRIANYLKDIELK